jgi:hypothetical protein
MEKSHKIALLSAGLLIGAQVGATVLTTETPDATLSESLAAEAEAPDTATPAEVAEAGSEATTALEAAPEPVAVAEPILPVSPRHAHYDTLPSPWEGQPMLPSLAAYLERTEHLRLTGAPGGVFPADDASMLPSLVAYLDQREVTRIAQTESPVGSEPVASAAIPASGSEVTLLDTTSPSTASSPY